MRENARKEGDYIISEDALGTSYKHPSFGMLSFNRTHGGHSNLFGSRNVAITICGINYFYECWNRYSMYY